jgi:hypothetical protein
LGIVAIVYNPIYIGGNDQEGQDWRLARAERVSKKRKGWEHGSNGRTPA